jgi:hypothetical protein
MTVRHPYPGKDLEAMSFAVNYHRWILDEMRPYLGRKIVEVGAGTGSFSEMLLAESYDSLALIEPSEMFRSLRANIALSNNGLEIDFYNTLFSEACEDLKGADSILYINVLEHIEDDTGEIDLVYRTLDTGGRCFIFVPALAWLYGKFDRKIGHFRRYAKTDLEQKVRNAGFRIIRSKYFDLPGVVPWYIKYRMLGSDSLGGDAVLFYDKLVVPVASRFERYLGPPLGKNILLIAEK